MKYRNTQIWFGNFENTEINKYNLKTLQLPKYKYSFKAFQIQKYTNIFRKLFQFRNTHKLFGNFRASYSWRGGTTTFIRSKGSSGLLTGISEYAMHCWWNMQCALCGWCWKQAPKAGGYSSWTNADWCWLILADTECWQPL